MTLPGEYPLAAKLAHLRRAESYPAPVSSVEAIETHMSWVFLTEAHAYKLKKPVRLEFLDFSTIGSRKASCEAELVLNRRLAAEVYLAVVPLALDEAGRLVVEGAGRPVDWMVKMQRLPRERMLDAALARGAVSAADIAALATVLSGFYRSLPAERVAPETLCARLARDTSASRAVLRAPEYALPTDRVERIADTLDRFVATRSALFARRVEDARVVEGHGDLRPEHVCLLPKPVVIDCLEFNRAFRIVDVADDLAFLSMECAHLGAPETGARIVSACCEALQDPIPPPLLAFYSSCRALLRAKLSVLHVPDVAADQHERWIGRARDYLDLAARYAEGL